MIQPLGTGGVSSWALKLAHVAGLKIILTSSSDERLERMRGVFQRLQTVNYATTPDWDDEVLKLTDGIGVDLVLENGGASSLVSSMSCTRRGGIISQVGYLGKQNPGDLKDLISTIVDRRIVLRYERLSIF